MIPSDIVNRISGRRMGVFDLDCTAFAVLAETHPHTISNQDPKQILLFVDNAFDERRMLPDAVAEAVEASMGEFDYLLITCRP